MNRPERKRNILLVLACVAALLAIAPVANAVGGEEIDAEPQATAVAPVPDEAADDDTGVLHAQVVRGLPFSNFDLLVLIAVLLGLSILSFTVHRLSRAQGRPPPEPEAVLPPRLPTERPLESGADEAVETPGEPAPETPVTTDAG